MSTLTIKVEPLATSVRFTSNAMQVTLADGREVSVPMEWFPRLRDAKAEQRNKWELIGDGIGIHWPELDEDIETESLLSV